MNTVAAPRDENGKPALMAVLNTDTVQGATLVPLAINQTDGAIVIDQNATISFTMQPVDPRDPNYVTCWFFKGLDGNLYYPAVATSSGALLVDLI